MFILIFNNVFTIEVYAEKCGEYTLGFVTSSML